MADESADQYDSKSFLQSKTFWANLGAVILPVIPGAQGWISGHSEMYSVGLGLLNIGLRAISNKSISWDFKF